MPLIQNLRTRGRARTSRSPTASMSAARSRRSGLATMAASPKASGSVSPVPSAGIPARAFARIFGNAFSEKGPLAVGSLVFSVLASVVDDGVALLRSRDRSFSHAPTERPTDDPLLQRLLGELASTAYIAKAVVLDAADAIGAATASMRDGVPDAELAAQAQLKVAKVKVHLDDVAPEAATGLLELGGASAASRKRNLDRHWRNIRTITLHNPVAYKARAIGQNLLHGTPVPGNAYF
jgi:alkylation response protein AidB-like acyl-CoA dehydrogenase